MIATRPRIKYIIRVATTAGLVVPQPLLTRLDVLVENAATAFLDTLDHSERTTAHLYLLNAAQVAGGAREHIVHGHDDLFEEMQHWPRL